MNIEYARTILAKISKSYISKSKELMKKSQEEIKEHLIFYYKVARMIIMQQAKERDLAIGTDTGGKNNNN